MENLYSVLAGVFTMPSYHPRTTTLCLLLLRDAITAVLEDGCGGRAMEHNSFTATTLVSREVWDECQPKVRDLIWYRGLDEFCLM